MKKYPLLVMSLVCVLFATPTPVLGQEGCLTCCMNYDGTTFCSETSGVCCQQYIMSTVLTCYENNCGSGNRNPDIKPATFLDEPDWLSGKKNEKKNEKDTKDTLPLPKQKVEVEKVKEV